MSQSRLTSADLRGVQATGSVFRGADLQNASLEFAQDLDSASFDGETVYNEWTVFPTNFDPAEAGLRRAPWIRGDFDADAQLDADDFDLMVQRSIRQRDFEGLYIIDEENLRIYNDESRTAAYTSDSIEGLYLVYASLTKGQNDEWLEPMYDVDGNGRINRMDWLYFVENVAGTWIGDSNLDGEFNSTDLITVFVNNEFEDDLIDNSSWATGDWNGDREFNSRDLISAFSGGGYEMGKRTAVATVPEPGVLGPLSLMMACFWWDTARESQPGRH